jgi:signal transduction histidine kinase
VAQVVLPGPRGREAAPAANDGMEPMHRPHPSRSVPRRSIRRRVAFAPAPLARRAARIAGRESHDLVAAAIARLVEIRDLSRFAHEVNRSARHLAGAQASQMTLRRAVHPGRSSAVGPARRAPRHPGGRIADPGLRGFTAVLALRQGARALGSVRLDWRRRPAPRRLALLRRYLAHASAALARILAEERLARQHRRYEALLDSLPDTCLLVVDRDGIVLGARGRLGRSAGVDLARLVGSPLGGGDGRPGLVRLGRTQLRQCAVAARSHGKAEIETWLQGASRNVQVLLTLVDLERDGEMVCVLRDLTDSKALELALLQRNDELRQAAERLKEIDVLKNEFMSNVSHELRTPLTAIIAYSESLLLAPPAPATQREFLQVIAEQGHKLQRLITGLLDIAKLESLATELKLQPSSLNDVVRAAIVTVQPLADKARIAIRAELAAELPAVYLDELRAQQIVWNLLTNAVKFSPPDSAIRVRTWSAGDSVWASVQDQGIGIAPEHQELIFEKFVQLDGSTTRRQGGVGLGLDLVKHLVELHGGTVGVTSVAGEGSTFTFSIPIEKRSKPRLDDRRRRPETARATS